MLYQPTFAWIEKKKKKKSHVVVFSVLANQSIVGKNVLIRHYFHINMKLIINCLCCLKLIEPKMRLYRSK